jgi:hypothetical protein
MRMYDMYSIISLTMGRVSSKRKIKQCDSFYKGAGRQSMKGKKINT